MTEDKADLKGNKVLFVAFFYPPVASTNIPGAMRTIKFIRNLSNGECHVLTTQPQLNESDSALNHLTLPVHGETIHRVNSWDIFKLLLRLRSNVKKLLGKNEQANATPPSPAVFKASESDVVATPSTFQQLKDFIYNLCYFPDQAGPWIFPAYLRGRQLVKKHNLTTIFATGSPWSGLIVGYLISKATGKPLIADFRDPWVNNPFHQSKGSLLDRWSEQLEKKVVEHASAISLNTEALREEFLERYQHIPKDRFFVMPNGFDEADFNDLPHTEAKRLPSTVTFCHAGFLYGVRDPAVLLDAIAMANEQLTPQGLKIRFIQVGDVQLAYDIRERYSSMINEGSLLLESARPYKECLAILKNADWVVNVQPATRSQVPSKLYDYLALNRPILNITPEDGALGRLVSKHHLGELFDFCDKDTLSTALISIAHSHKDGATFEGYSARPSFNCGVITAGLAERICQLSE
jgi:hypothetical protein